MVKKKKKKVMQINLSYPLWLTVRGKEKKNKTSKSKETRHVQTFTAFLIESPRSTKIKFMLREIIGSVIF